MQKCLLQMWKKWSVAIQLMVYFFSNNMSYCDVLLAIAQQSEVRWPDSEGQRFDSQKSWSVKPLNEKQTWPTSCPPTNTTYDVLKKDHHLSRHIFRPSFAIMWEKGDCAKLRWWPGPRTSPLCFYVRMIMTMMMVMMLLWQFRWRWSWRYWEIKWV